MYNTSYIGPLKKNCVISLKTQNTYESVKTLGIHIERNKNVCLENN